MNQTPTLFYINIGTFFISICWLLEKSNKSHLLHFHLGDPIDVSVFISFNGSSLSWSSSLLRHCLLFLVWSQSCLEKHIWIVFGSRGLFSSITLLRALKAVFEATTDVEIAKISFVGFCQNVKIAVFLSTSF